MGYYGFPSYVTVAEKKARAKAALIKLSKTNPDLEPIIIEGRTLAKSWWGRAWNTNLESYADYSNRVGRGKSYVRCNAVLDLKISAGRVAAKVQGSRAKPYDTLIKIDTLSDTKWQRILELCNRRIESLEQLMDGKFPEELKLLFTDHSYAMFPSPQEIHFDCSCPDYATMCKHVAAVLYGVGTRLDQDALLFFELRDVDGNRLIRKTMQQRIKSMLENAGSKSPRQIAAQDIGDIFGL